MTSKDGSLPQPPPPVSPTVLHVHPFGLRAIIVLLIVQAVGYMVTVGLLLLGDALSTTSRAELADLMSQVTSLVIAYSILAPLNLLAAVGLWRRKRWAWMMIMMLLAASMTLDLAAYWVGQPTYFSMALNVIKVGYLNQREVQMIFGEASGQVKR